MLAFLLACSPPSDPPAAPPYAVPNGAPFSLHDPNAAVHVWPDDAHTEVDPSLPTGRRVHLTDGADADFRGQLPETFVLIEALEQLDGFGLNAPIYLRFSDDLDPATVRARLIDRATLTQIPFETTFTDHTSTLILRPTVPLQPATAHLVVIEQGLATADGRLVHPGLHDHALARSIWADTLAALDLPADDVVAGTHFTTQSLRDQDDLVADLLTDTPAWQRTTCYADGDRTVCEGTLRLADLLGEDGTLSLDDAPAIVRHLDVPVTLWLPPGDGPFPVALYGHGLGGDRGEGGGFSRWMAPAGFAVAAIDAPRHGDHPTARYTDLLTVLDFFGVTLGPPGFDALRLRDDFRAAAWDKLQLTTFLASAPDLTGDGVPDLDGRVVYVGHSLGGILGPQHLGMDTRIPAAVLSVPGGRVSEIVHTSSTFAPLIALMAPPGTTTGTIDRFFPVLQTAIDPADPATWALRARSGRDLLVTAVLDDHIVPDPTGHHLARALQIPHAAPIARPIDGLPAAPDAPFSANLDGTTVALRQFTDATWGGVPGVADHSSVFDADQHTALVTTFLSSALLDGRATVPGP